MKGATGISLDLFNCPSIDCHAIEHQASNLIQCEVVRSPKKRRARHAAAPCMIVGKLQQNDQVTDHLFLGSKERNFEVKRVVDVKTPSG